MCKILLVPTVEKVRKKIIIITKLGGNKRLTGDGKGKDSGKSEAMEFARRRE